MSLWRRNGKRRDQFNLPEVEGDTKGPEEGVRVLDEGVKHLKDQRELQHPVLTGANLLPHTLRTAVEPEHM